MTIRHTLLKLFPHPLVSSLIFFAWLMLQHSVSVGNIILAAVISWLIPRLLHQFIIPTPQINWKEAAKLFFIVVWDIIICNIRVAKLVLGSTKNLHPQWFRVPLDTNHDQVNSLLAMIITTTPGTVTAGVDLQRGDILVHSLNITADVESEIQDIKSRYEQSLIRIFNVEQNSATEEQHA